jgi:hypothetical protein
MKARSDGSSVHPYFFLLISLTGFRCPTQKFGISLLLALPAAAFTFHSFILATVIIAVND